MKIIGDKSKVTVSKTIELIKNKYSNQEEKDAIESEILGTEEDKFPGSIIYHKPVSKLNKDIVIIIDDDLNVSADTKDSPIENNNPISEYEKNENIYYYEPDVSKFNPKTTYYVTYDENGQNEKIYGRIDKVDKPISGWHDYESKMWGNVVTVNEDSVTYWTWVPRYKYKMNGNDAEVCFVDLAGNCKIVENGIDKVVDVSTYELPECFDFANVNLKGYWMSKYEVQYSKTSGIEEMKAVRVGSDNQLTTSNPKGTYTIYVDGEKKLEGISLPYSLDKINKNDCEITLYSEENKRMVGTIKKSKLINEILNDIIKVDLNGFNPDCTYYVTYDDNGENEQIGEKVQLDGQGNLINMPENWYDYENKRWANIVTKGTDKDGKELITYWTYVPRYEYSMSELYTTITGNSDVKFIKKTQTEADDGYIIPEGFTFNGEQLNGYWMSKFEVQGTID